MRKKRIFAKFLLVITALGMLNAKSIQLDSPGDESPQNLFHCDSQDKDIQDSYNKVMSVFQNSRTNMTEDEQKDVAMIIAEHAKEAGFSVELILAVMKTESSFKKNARSNVGAIGLMQLMPATGRAMAREMGIIINSKQHLYNPQMNVVLGIRYLKKLSDRFKDMNMVLAAYNMGPTNFRRYRREGKQPGQKYTRLVNDNHSIFNQI